MASSYTPTTVATLVQASLEQNPAGTTVPSAALIAIAQNAYKEIWNAYEWAMRYGTAATAWEPGEQVIEKLAVAATVENTGNPAWDPKFDPGWITLSQAYIQRDFRNDARWVATYQQYEAWLKKLKVEDDRQFWTDLIAAAAQDMWTLKGMTYQVCFEIFNARVEADQALLAKRTLLAAVGNIVAEAQQGLWDSRPWAFRKARATISTVASQVTLALPSDFGQLSDEVMNDDDESMPFTVTEDGYEFEESRRSDPDGTGEPQLGLIENAMRGDWLTGTVYEVSDIVTVSTTYYRCATAHTAGTWATDLAAVKWVATTALARWRLRFFPIPDAVYDYPITYMRALLPLGLTAQAQWPQSFNRGWHALATLEAQRRFGTKGRADEAKKELDEWMEDAIGNLGRQMQRQERIDTDPYGDLGGMGSRRGYSTTNKLPWFR